MIVKKFVSDITNKTNTTIDNFVLPGAESLFLKIDVEGAESRLLKGCKRILAEQKQMKVAICTYHKQDDENEFSSLLKLNRFNITHSDGYMLFLLDKKLKAPYFRRGLIRAEKM